MLMLSKAIREMKTDLEVCYPPDDSVSALEFSPSAHLSQYLCAGSWDHSIRIWRISLSGKTKPLIMQTLDAPILDVSWSDDASKIYASTAFYSVYQWDLGANQITSIGTHDAGVRTCHWIKGNSYSCLMTGSWDKTLKFWDTRSQSPLKTISLPERCFAADVLYPMAVVATASPNVIVYSLEQEPREYSRLSSPIRKEVRAIAVCRDDGGAPDGYVAASNDGSLNVQCLIGNEESYNLQTSRLEDPDGTVNIYAANDVKVDPADFSIAAAGSDGSYSFWDRKKRCQIKKSNLCDQPITKCSFSSDGRMFAYALGYDWAQGFEFNNPKKKPQIFLNSCSALKMPD